MKRPRVRMNRLSRKFIAGAVLILLITLAGTIFVNSRIAGKFYLHEQREYVREIGERLTEELESGRSPREAAEIIEEQEKVLIVWSEETGNPDVLANELRENFRQKGLGFQKFWLWDRDYETAVQNGSQFRLYSQTRMNYSILVEYLPLESGLFAIAAIVPDAQGFIAIINRLGLLIDSCAILVAVILISILTGHITKPLEEVCAFTRNVASKDFRPLKIRTHDELEDVADSLNAMSHEIEQYQKKLEEKNEEMKLLLNNVAHDLKTPISLVGMYAAGIRDGLDDGTFLDTIIRQNAKMSRMTEKLLNLSRLEQKEYPREELLLDQILERCFSEQKALFDRRNLEPAKKIQPDLRIQGNSELLWELFSNLLSNAAKYAAPGRVHMELERQEETYVFRISNRTDNPDLDLSRIWQPFYVGESSRNQELSGTGLGLPAVKKIAEQSGYEASCRMQDGEITFEVIFPL